MARAFDGSNNLVLDLRIQNMGTSAGQIELFNLYSGAGTTLTQSWDLVNVWNQLKFPTNPPIIPPPEPPPNNPGPDDIVLTDGNDSWIGSANGETVWGKAGSDSLQAGGGGDTIYGDGSDGVSGGSGNDTVLGDDSNSQASNDSLSGESGDDFLFGFAGNDNLDGGADNDILLGGDGDDTLSSGTGVDWVDGGAGTDAAVLDLQNQLASIYFVASTAASNSGLTLATGSHIQNLERFFLSTGSGDDTANFDLGFTGLNNWSAGLGFDRLAVDLSAATQTVTLSHYNSDLTSGYVAVGLIFFGPSFNVGLIPARESPDSRPGFPCAPNADS